MIVPYGMTDEELREHPIGTGPFMFESITPGERLELVRNDNYWGEMPLLETITIIQITDPSARVLALQAGDIDMALDIMPPDMAPIEADPNLVLNRRLSLSTDYIGFNNDKPPFDDARVRQAINYAFNTEAVVNAIWMGQGAVQHGPIPAQAFGAIDVEPFDFNVERARELMEEAGHADGFSASMWFNTGNQARSDAAEALQAALREINIDLTVEGVEWADYLDRTAAGEHDMFILGWVTVTGDADYGLFPLFHTENLGEGGNRTFFSDSRVDELLDQGRSETDPVAREAIYAEVQQIIRDEAAWVFLRNGENVIGHTTNLRGFRNHPAAHHSFFNIWFE
jgi:peptide/nickel transport system substrate-binding protein